MVLLNWGSLIPSSLSLLIQGSSCNWKRCGPGNEASYVACVNWHQCFPQRGLLGCRKHFNVVIVLVPPCIYHSANLLRGPGSLGRGQLPCMSQPSCGSSSNSRAAHTPVNSSTERQVGMPSWLYIDYHESNVLLHRGDNSFMYSLGLHATSPHTKLCQLQPKIEAFCCCKCIHDIQNVYPQNITVRLKFSVHYICKLWSHCSHYKQDLHDYCGAL